MDEESRIGRRDEISRELLEFFAHKETRPEYLAAVVDVLGRWTGCRCVGIRVLDESGRIPYDAYTGYSEEFWRRENNLSTQCDTCICIRVIRQEPEPQDGPLLTPGGSMRCNNTSCLMSGMTPEQRARYRGACVHHGFQSLAVVPIRFRDLVLGAIHLADEREGMAGEDVVESVEAIALLIGEAVHRFNVEEALRRNNEVLKEQAERLQQLGWELTQVEQRERRRLAEILHDHLQQLLVGARYGLDVVLRRDDLARAREAARNVDAVLSEAITVTRSLNVELSPPVLQQHGLARGLEWLGKWMRDKHGLNVELDIDPKANHRTPVTDALLFHCVRELLFNTVKHAGVDRARVKLGAAENGWTEILVHDDGAGFDPESIEAGEGGSFGMASIRERIALIGGRFEIDSAPGKGARFRLTAPPHKMHEQPSCVQLAPAKGGE